MILKYMISCPNCGKPIINSSYILNDNKPIEIYLDALDADEYICTNCNKTFVVEVDVNEEENT